MNRRWMPHPQGGWQDVPPRAPLHDYEPVGRYERSGFAGGRGTAARTRSGAGTGCRGRSIRRSRRWPRELHHIPERWKNGIGGRFGTASSHAVNRALYDALLPDQADRISVTRTTQ